MSLPELESSMIYVPIVSPPTPAPSPGPPEFALPDPVALATRAFASFSPSQRRSYLSAILDACSRDELQRISVDITPRLRRDFLRDLPPEVAIHLLSFIDDPRSLLRASRVSRYWNSLLSDEWLWKTLCRHHGFQLDSSHSEPQSDTEPFKAATHRSRHSTGSVSALTQLQRPTPSFSYRAHFKVAYTIMSQWRNGGTLLRTHRVPLTHSTHPPNPPLFPNIPLPPVPPPPPSSAIPTSIALDASWVVVGLANSRIHVFSARTGVLSRTLVGHSAGVWAVALIKGGGDSNHPEDVRENVPEPAFTGQTAAGPSASLENRISPTLRGALGLDATPSRRRRRSMSGAFPCGTSADHQPSTSGKVHPFGKPSDPAGASDGWGQPNALVVSGGCDKELRVWDVKSGYCIYILRGHSSTIRCLKVLHNRPIAVSGSRDRTVRVWDVQRGRMLRVLEGHEQSVRCLDVCGNKVVSGSYDCSCRLWDVDTGECLHVLRGHFHQIYSVAFDGVRVASGGLDTTVRVWDANTGTCLALLQGHTALVCQLQLSPTMLATGGSDGRVITFSLGSSYAVVQRLAAHDSSVTGLQLDEQFLVTGGNDGRVRLFQFDRDTGKCDYVRELSEPSESVWKVAFTRETCAIMCKRAGKTVMEIWSFRPKGRS